MSISILVPMKDSKSSRVMADYLASLPLCPAEVYITLLHVFKAPTAGERLMDGDFLEQEEERLKTLMEDSKAKLVEQGMMEDHITVRLFCVLTATVAEGILEEFGRKKYDMVVLGRRRKSKSEEFVMGDISVKLVRALEKTAVLVVKSE